MSDFLKIIQSVLPVPILIGVSIFVIGAWILKQIRGYTNNYPLFKDKFFYILFALSFFGVISFYVFKTYKANKPEVQFSLSDLGIYICHFANDPRNEVAKAIEAALLFKINKENFNSMKIFISISSESPPEDQLYEIGSKRNADLVISGILVHANKYWVQITNPEKRTAKRIAQQFDINNPDEIVKVIETELLWIIQTKDNNETQIVENRVTEALDLIAALQYRLESTENRVEKLEKFLDATGIASKDTTYAKEQPIKHIGEAWAVLIGIADYETKDLSDLKYPVEDVKAMEKLLLKAGYKKEHIITLLNTNATTTNIQMRMVDFLRQNTLENDKVLLYYSGHAITQKGQSGKDIGFLCPSNFSFTQLVSTGISMSQFKEWLDLIPAKQIALIVDACFAGIIGLENLTSRGVVEPRSLKFSGSDLIPPKPMLIPTQDKRNLVILSAGDAEQAAFEGPRWGHGLFTFHILNGMMGKADLNRDGVVLAEELYNYVYPKVVNDSNNRQNPRLFGWGIASVPIVELKESVFMPEEFLEPQMPMR